MNQTAQTGEDLDMVTTPPPTRKPLPPPKGQGRAIIDMAINGTKEQHALAYLKRFLFSLTLEETIQIAAPGTLEIERKIQELYDSNGCLAALVYLEPVARVIRDDGLVLVMPVNDETKALTVPEIRERFRVDSHPDLMTPF